MDEIDFLESQIIAAFIVDNDSHRYIKQLSEEFFTKEKNKFFYKYIKQLYIEKQEINIITINNKISAGTKNQGVKAIEEMCKITNSYIAASSIENSIRKLQDVHTRNQLINTLNKYTKQINLPDTDINNLKNSLLKELNEIKNQSNEYGETAQDVFLNTLDTIENKHKKGIDYSLCTGFFRLDALTDGLHENELTCIGARPGTGKTAFALQIATNIAYKGKNVYYNCLEMSSEQLMTRIISSYGRINSQSLRNGVLEENELKQFGTIAGKISELKLKIDTSTKYIEDIENMAYVLKDRNELDLLIIDYLTLLKSKSKYQSRELEVADISRRLKLLALELHIPVVILVQLNRDAENKVPTMANIRESGSIEQNCDNIIFLYNSDEDTNVPTVDVILEKQRQGTTGNLKLKFWKCFSTFSNPT